MLIVRHVILPEDMAGLIPKTHLMTESEWRNLGIQMTTGWVHYMRYAPGEYLVYIELNYTLTDVTKP